ncbi:asparagine--tRNA ligase [Candidatus Dojkabacteria bacterium]|nr:asparagine--tRNA ligase [Candidatus Dojkabacteria bacterium]
MTDKILKSHKCLDDLKLNYRKIQFPASTEKGATNVARAIGGFSDRQMVKTLIFYVPESKQYALIMVGGDQSAASKNLKKIFKTKNVRMATPEEVKELTGYVVGSIPPFSWQGKDTVTLIETSLMNEKELGVGTGTWGQEIIISPENLVKASQAEIYNLVDPNQDIVNYKMKTPEIDIESLKLDQKYETHEVAIIPEKEKLSISQLPEYAGKTITLECWMQNKRSSGKITFLQLRDGSGFIQAIVEKSKVEDQIWDTAEEMTIQSSSKITGTVTKHPKKEEYEIHVSGIELIQLAEDYPIGKKEHGPEFLFDNRDLYLRSKTPWAVLRIRNQIFLSITNFFAEQDFIRFDTPILQPTSCEDTTQLFDLKYYDTMMYLSQSGQLYSEAGIMSFGKVYDFGPVFRAEKSKTRHHLSELWMMDAEMAFFNQKMNMVLQERMVKRIVKDVLEFCKVELTILERDTKILEKVVAEPFIHLTHYEAKRLLQQKGFTVNYDDDMTTEEEIFLGNHYNNCIFIEDYPFKVKSFYMKKYTDDKGIEHAVNSDLVAPEEGREIIGGSQREDDFNTCLEEIKRRNYPIKDYKWYLDIRKYGSVPHSGFGIGLERTVRWITGIHHIRETIPFPRTLTRNKP